MYTCKKVLCVIYGIHLWHRGVEWNCYAVVDVEKGSCKHKIPIGIEIFILYLYSALIHASFVIFYIILYSIL